MKILGWIDLAVTIILLIMGFQFYRQPRNAFLKSFPFRPMTLLSWRESVSPQLSYFYRPHKSTKHRPIVLVHGVGIGLAPYIPLLSKVPKDIGILAIELLPVSSHVTTSMPPSIDLIDALVKIVAQQNLQDFVFVGHSYGTFFTSLFLRSPYLAARTHSIVMIDPVALLLHCPHVAYNFTKRKPEEANEWQLYWAVQTDPDIAFTIGRRFCWREHVVWKEDLAGRKTTVIVGGRDNLVDPEAIASYITRGDWEWTDADTFAWQESPKYWKGEDPLELVWLEGYDHGQSFLSPKMLPTIVRVIERYSQLYEKQDSNADQLEPDEPPPSVPDK